MKTIDTIQDAERCRKGQFVVIKSLTVEGYPKPHIFLGIEPANEFGIVKVNTVCATNKLEYRQYEIFEGGISPNYDYAVWNGDTARPPLSEEEAQIYTRMLNIKEIALWSARLAA